MVGDLDSRRERVGVLLSGGMDSSVLTRVGQSRLGMTRSYSGGYPFEAERDNRERRYATSAAEAFGTEHRYFQTTVLGYMEDLVRSIAAVEEPVHHQQTVCALSLFRSALRPDEDIVLSGMGAGGIFGTPLQQLIHRYRLAPTLYRSLSVGPVRRALQLASRASGRGIKLLKTIALTGRVDVAPADPASPVWAMDAYGSADWARAYYGVGEDGLARSRAHLLSRFDGRSLLEMITVFDQYDKTALLWGKAAQATGKILYLPFMQKRLHHLMLPTPWPLQLSSNKHILARVGQQVGIPDSILFRAKSGFGVRRKDWALRGGPLEPLVPVAAKGFDEAEIRRMQSDDPVKLNMFWNMLNYGVWKRLCIDGEPVEALLEELGAAARS